MILKLNKLQMDGKYYMEKLQQQKMKGNNSYIDLKENNVYGFRKSTTKMLARSTNAQVSLTQSLFPSKKSSLKNITNKNSVGLSDFYQTLSSGFGLQWSRPESKHASRRQSNRPQTSKGARTTGQESSGGQRNRCIQESQILKSSFPSKSMYNSPSQQQALKRKQGQIEGQEYQQDLEAPNFKNIRIVVTRSDKPRQEKSFYNDKFQTNLPDDFLSLFAD